MSKLKKFKDRALITGEILTMAGMMAFAAKNTKPDTTMQYNKILKPHCLNEAAAIEMFQNTTLDLGWVDEKRISVNGEILLHEAAVAKYPHERRAITAFVHYHWHLNEKQNAAPTMER